MVLVWGGISLIINKLRNGLSPLPYSWFIPAILIYYLGFYWSARVVKNLSMLIILMICFSTLFAAVTYMLHFGSFWYLSAYTMVAGIFVAANENRIKNNIKMALFALVIISIAICYVSDLFAFQIKPLYLVYNVAISIVFYSSIRIVGFPQSRILDYLGKISLEIYLLHGVLIYFITPLGLSALPTVLLVILSTIAAASVANIILTRPLKLTLSKKNV